MGVSQGLISAEQMVSRCKEQFSLGRYADAAVCFQDMVDAGCAAISVYLLWADAVRRQGDVAEAVNILGEALTVAEEHSIYYARSRYQAISGNWDFAIKDVSHALSLAPENPYYYYGRAQYHEKKEEWSVAYAECHCQCLIWAAEVDIYIAPERAIERSEAAAQFAASWPEQVEAFTVLGRSFSRSGQHLDAVAAFTLAIQSYPISELPSTSSSPARDNELSFFVVPLARGGASCVTSRSSGCFRFGRCLGV